MQIAGTPGRTCCVVDYYEEGESRPRVLKTAPRHSPEGSELENEIRILQHLSQHEDVLQRALPKIFAAGYDSAVRAAGSLHVLRRIIGVSVALLLCLAHLPRAAQPSQKVLWWGSMTSWLVLPPASAGACTFALLQLCMYAACDFCA